MLERLVLPLWLRLSLALPLLTLNLWVLRQLLLPLAPFPALVVAAALIAFLQLVSRGLIRKFSDSLMQSVSIRVALVKLNN